MSLSLQQGRGGRAKGTKADFFDLLPRTTKMSFKESLPPPNRLGGEMEEERLKDSKLEEGREGQGWGKVRHTYTAICMFYWVFDFNVFTTLRLTPQWEVLKITVFAISLASGLYQKICLSHFQPAF